MIKWASSKIIDIMITNKKQYKSRRAVYIYGLECILTDSIQILLILLVGIISSRTIRIISFSLGFTFIKTSVGGFHAPSHCKCIITYTTIAIVGLALLEFNLYPSAITLISTLVLIITAHTIKPVSHPNNPKSVHSINKAHHKAKIKSYLIGFTTLALHGLSNVKLDKMLFASVSAALPLGACFAVLTLPIEVIRKEINNG